MDALDPKDYGENIEAINAWLDRAKLVYKNAQEYQGYSKTDRVANIEKAKRYAGKLLDLLPLLCVDQFDYGKDNTRNDLETTLPFFITQCEQAIPQQRDNPTTNRRADKLLKKNLYDVFKRFYRGEKSHFYKQKKSKQHKGRYVGPYIDFLRYALPYCSVSAIRAEAFAKFAERHK